MDNKIEIIPDGVRGSKQRVRIDFDALYEGVKAHPTPPKEVVQMPNFEQQFGTNISALAENFVNIDKMNESELQNLISSTYAVVLNYCTSTGSIETQFIWNLFNNTKYVMGLAKLLSTTPIELKQIMAINHVLYNMYVVRNQLKPEVLAAHMELSKVVNASVIIGLSGVLLPFGEKTAADIGMCIYSTPYSNIAIQRLNLYMINCSEESEPFTEETMVNIYVNLYGNALTKLFEGIMFDVYSRDDLNNFTETQQNCYYRINLALCDILVQAPTQVIYAVLEAYTIDYSAMPAPYRRFSMRTLSNDYKRIIDVIEILEQNKIFVP